MRSSGLSILGSFLTLLLSSGAFATELLGETKLFYKSEPGDIVGQGNSRQFGALDGSFTTTFTGPNSIRFAFDGKGESWIVEIEARDGAPLIRGPFENATDFRYHSPTKPGIRVTANGRACDWATGRFDLRELESFGAIIVSFAVDLEQRCEGAAEPLYMEVRHSASTSFPKPFDWDFDGVPDTLDNCKTVRNPSQSDDDFDLRGDVCDTPVNNTFVAFSSPTGDPLGGGRSFTLRPRDGVIKARHEAEKRIEVAFDGDDDWKFFFGAPDSERLEAGLYEGALPPDAKGPELLVSHSARNCANPSGLFEIHEVVFEPDDTVSRLAVDFVQSCDGAPPLSGTLRYEATDFIMLSPKPGATLSNATVTFEWSDHASASKEFWLYVGTTKGSKNILDTESLGPLTSVQVSGLPTDGSPIWIRLWVKTIRGWKWADYQYTSVTFTFIPEIVKPAPSSVLPGGSARFEWAANGLDVTSWQLTLGSRFAGDGLFKGPITTSTYADVTGLPTDGSTVFARLWFSSNKIWDYEDFVYTSDASGGTPELTDPAPGSTLAGGDVSFAWQANGSVVTKWLVYVGTTPGNWDLFNSGTLAATTTRADASGLPTDGSTVFVRLWYVSGNWQYKDYQYTTPDLGGRPAIVSPQPGTQLTSTDATFEWTPNGSIVSTWWLTLGTSPGASDLFDSGALGGTTVGAFVTGLPTDGSTIHARLWYVSGQWKYADYQFTAADIGGKPAMVSPADGATLSGADVTFVWAPGGSMVKNWQLYLGSKPGGQDLLDTGGLAGNVTTMDVTNLPTDGSAVYARLWYTNGGSVWSYEDYSFTAASTGGLPALISPAPGTTLSGADVDFTWTRNGSRVQSWRLKAGVSRGGNQLFDSGKLDVAITTTTVSGLPLDGSTVHVTLDYVTGAGYFTIEAQYTASAAGGTPQFTSPTPNSVLTGDTVTLTWTVGGTAVKSFWLNVGSAPGTNDLFSSGSLDASARSALVSGLPTNGSQVWVQLWYQKQDDSWMRVDVWYMAVGG